MKKVFMFLLSATLVTSAFAQKGYDKHNQPYNNGYNAGRERDVLIDRINANYDNRIASVEHDRFLSGRDKKRDIKQLEKQRKQELKETLARFDSDKNRQYRDGMARNDRRY